MLRNTYFPIINDMKKILLFALIVLGATSCFAQTKSNPSRNDSLLVKIDSLLQANNSLLDHIELNLSLKQRFKLYPTENIYNFLQLDTKTGIIEQVQWSLDSDNEGSVSINSEDLTYGFGYGSGSFELYPTKNMYQFLLLDKTTGRKWHVQWGMKSSERWIRRIY